MPGQTDVVRSETFAPILYVIDLRRRSTEALALHNDVPQDLSSIFTTRRSRGGAVRVRRAAPTAASRMSTSARPGAEIGGAFGGRRRPVVAGNPAPTREVIHAPSDEHGELLDRTCRSRRALSSARASCDRCYYVAGRALMRTGEAVARLTSPTLSRLLCPMGPRSTESPTDRRPADPSG